MPATLSKGADAAEEAKRRQRASFLVIVSIFFSVLQHVIQLQAEPLLIRRLVQNDPVTTARVMANTSGVIGLLGLLVNQVGGKLSDKIGRKPGFFVGPLFSIVAGMIVHRFPHSFNAVVICRVLRILLTGFSSSVMCSAALSDLVSGKELSAAFSSLGASVGLAVVVAPITEGLILNSTDMDITKPALALTALGAVHTLFLAAFLPETNPAQMSISEALSSLDLSGINPLGFLSLFARNEALEEAKRRDPSSKEVEAALHNRRIIGKLVVIATLQSFMEGKNVTDIVQVWQREHLKWDAFGMRDFTVMYGVLCYLAGQFLTPALLRKTSPRTFTSLTNMTNTLGFCVRGSVESPLVFWGAVPLMLPGVNAASSSAVKSMATDRAIAAGIGRGELSAWINNLRALTVATAPVIYGQFYGWAVENGIFPGYAFWVAALLGGVVPELIHQTMSRAETCTLQGEQKALVDEGVRLGEAAAATTKKAD